MTETKDDDLDFRKIEFTSPAHCVIVKLQAEPFLNGKRELSQDDYANLELGIQKARKFLEAESQKQKEEITREQISKSISEMESIENQLTAIAELQKEYAGSKNRSRELYSIGNIQKKTIDYVSRKALFEEGNINKVGHAILSAHTDSPINLMFLAPPSEGKTYVITNTAGAFPDQHIKMYRDASPKSFTRNMGELAIRQIKDGTKEYLTTIENHFTHKEVKVGEYLSWLKEEIEKKNPEFDRSELKETLDSVQQNLVTLISLEHQTIIFLDRPNPELWKSMLSVLSHDTYYTESMFVEGVGVLHTKTIVFKGWPAFIFATTKDEAATFQDIESRFEICEPVMRQEKYNAAIGLKLNNTLGIQSEDDKPLKELKRDHGILIRSIQNLHARPLMPYDPDSIFKQIFGQEIIYGGLMRQIPRLFQHVGLNALWNLADRVHLTNGEETYVVISADDLRVLSTLYGDLKLNALLSGLTASYYEFLSSVILPLFKDKDDIKEKTKDKVELKDIRETFLKYAQSDENQELKKDKMAFNRYMKFFVEKGYLEKIEDEEDKRKKFVVLLVEPETFSDSIEEKIKKIGTSAKTLAPPYLGSLLNRNFTAFYKGQKLGTTSPEKAGIGKNLQNENVQETQENTDYVVNTILSLSGYLPAFVPNVVPNFTENDDMQKTQENTDYEANEKNSEIQKSAKTLDVPIFLVEKTIVEILETQLNGNSGTRVSSLTILEEWPNEKINLKPTDEALNSEILPTMAGLGLISMSNGKIALTGKKLEENEKIEYVLISALEDLPALAWKDRDYYVHQGDICHMPKEVVNTLMKQNRKIRIIEGNGQINEPAEISLVERGGQ